VEVSRFEKVTAAASIVTLILTYLILAATVHWPPFDSAANSLNPSPAAAAITPSTASPLTTAATPSDAVSVSLTLSFTHGMASRASFSLTPSVPRRRFLPTHSFRGCRPRCAGRIWAAGCWRCFRRRLLSAVPETRALA
jgi:hypothetical protein